MSIARSTAGALALATALVGGASPAAAAFGPRPIQTSISHARISCTGDTVAGTAEVVTSDPVVVEVALLAQQPRGFAETGRTTVLSAVPGTTSYTFEINVAGLPLDVLGYRVVLQAPGTDVVRSNDLPAHRCAPDAVVPEVPSAVLLPLSLSCTALLVLAVRRRIGAATP